MKRLPIASLLVAAGLAGTVPALAQDAPAPAPQGGPANLCQELLAFVKQPEPAKQAAATPPAQATAVSNPSGKSEAAPSSAGGEPQQKSGLSGPPGGTSPDPGAGHKAAVAQANAAAKNPPAPGAPAPKPQPDPATVASIETAAASNDQAQCRAAARSMRVAGVDLPPPLLALAALDLKFFQR